MRARGEQASWSRRARVEQSSRPRRARGDGQRGVALLLAMLTMVLLTVVVLEFTVSTQVQYRRAVMWLKTRRADLVAEGGVMLAAELLHHDSLLGKTDSLADLWARELPPIDTGGGMLSVRIEDEQGKLNANSLATGALSPPGRRFQALLENLALDPGLAFALADWVDRNREPGASALAAEDGWYSAQETPLTARNAPLRSFAEMALVRGFSPTVLARLRRHVTVLPNPDLKVNPNTASPEVLAALDSRLSDESLVRRLVEARRLSPFTSTEALRAVEGMQAFSAADIEGLFSFSTRWFRVRSTGDVDGAMRSVEALLNRESGGVRVMYLLPRRGPNIGGVDSAIRARIDDAGLFGASRP
jgi:general secretion pathway protein K